MVYVTLSFGFAINFLLFILCWFFISQGLYNYTYILQKMSSPQKRPFKIWSKSHDFGHNFSRFEHFVFATPCVPPSATYFSAARYSKSVAFSRVILRSTEYAYLSREAIEAFRKVISPHFRKKKNSKKKRPGKFYIRCYPHLPLMKKPAEVRMGGGKGAKLRTYVCPVRPGQLLFEITFRSATWATAILKRASRKLNFRVSVSTLLLFSSFINGKYWQQFYYSCYRQFWR